MGRHPIRSGFSHPQGIAWAFAFSLLVLAAASPGFAAPAGPAGPTGKIQGKVVGTDTGEPIGFADITLFPADTTMKRVGGLTNADGTFLLVAAPGRYSLQIRALSYAKKRVEGIVIEEGKLLPFDTALAPEAIQQEEVVVEAKARENTEASMLSARKKAAAVGDAVSAEQVRRSPDKDVAEVLRRVTGLSVADGKYVYVRGLGERYSSTEIDGVRIASPEQNKRVVPLDLIPSNLLENVVVQKTYTADRAGEFAGGDVQVHTKDFPGNRTWAFSISQGYSEGATFESRSTYASTRADIFGFGSRYRQIPDQVLDVAGNRPLFQSNDPARGFPKSTLASLGKSFADVWSPISARTIPNATYAVSYGDELKLLGRPLGLISSWNLSRWFDHQKESQRFFQDVSDTLYDYAVERFRESAQLGGIAGLSYRLSPRHALHLRGLFTNSADDEVRTYMGPDHNRIESTTGTWLVHDSTRLMYVQRSVLSGTAEGRHELSHLLNSTLNWKFTRSYARRQQPDRRETTYDRRFYDDGTGNLVEYWSLGSTGSREYGDLKEDGWGTTVDGAVPYRLGGLGNGKLLVGYDRQTKERHNFYRRFNLYPNTNADRTLPPDSIFSDPNFDGTTSSGYVEEATLDIDNYRANQKVSATYLSVDVPFGRRVRGNFGVRAEQGSQDVASFDLFNPGRITQEGKLDNHDLLPSANMTWSVTDAVNLRVAASRTLSRPDLNELSPSPSLEYVGGMRVSGNPNLHRARLENYDVRLEAFPALSEVLAAGFFYKRMYEPIEQVIQGGAPPLLVPRNSDHGRNSGVELEARSGLGRIARRLNRLSINANASFISSVVKLQPQISKIGSEEHPLQGQANYLVNAALTYVSGGGKLNATILLGATGRRLKTLGLYPLPDIYEQPVKTLDASMNLGLSRNSSLKFGAKNLLDPNIQQLQDGKEVSGYHAGRSFSVAYSYGT